MEIRVHIDFETRSAVDLRGCGLYVYAEDHTTRPWGFCYSFGEGFVYRWRLGDPTTPPLQRLLDHVALGGKVVAHNAAFERVTWNEMIRRYPCCAGWPEMRIEQQECTMARAMALALPGSLDDLGGILGLTEQKDKAGKSVMMKLAKPRKILEDGTIIWHEDPNDIEIQWAYCEQDVRSEEAIDNAIPQLSPHEQKIWELDQRINDRGVYVDLPAVIRAVDLVEITKRRNNAEIKKLTDGAVTKCSEVAKIIEWLKQKGLEVSTFTKDDHEEIITNSSRINDPEVRAKVQRVVELRRASSKTSTSKFAAMMKCACEDNRIRGLLAYHGAATGRWAGRLVQPQNFPRVDEDREGPLSSFVINALGMENMSLSEIYDFIEIVAPDGGVQMALSKALRGMIRAAPKKKLVGGDFSNIEGRINAWLARETWKLDAFEKFDRKEGPDLYKVTAAEILGRPVDYITKEERQGQGKVPELACGFGGGVGAFMKMLGSTDPYALVGPVKNTATEEEWTSTLESFTKATDRHGLPQDPWTAIKLIVRKWRGRHPLLVAAWKDLQQAAVDAIDNPGSPMPVYGGMARYLFNGGWLYCQLPSTRVLCYPSARVDTLFSIEAEREDGNIRVQYEQNQRERKLASLESEGYKILWDSEHSSRNVSFVGRIPQSNKFGKKRLYGGLQCENIVQATARCVMDRAMLRAEEHNYTLILTVHDELLSETEDSGLFSAKQLQLLMEMKEDWMTDLPLAAAAWEDYRYVK